MVKIDISSKRFRIEVALILVVALGFAFNYLFNAGPSAEDNLDYRQFTHQQLVDMSTDIFHGKVIKKIGSRLIGLHQEYQYDVAVQDPNSPEDKGSVTGEVIVSSTFENIRDGNTMVFYTKYNKEQNWYSVIITEPYDDFGPAFPNTNFQVIQVN